MGIFSARISAPYCNTGREPSFERTAPLLSGLVVVLGYPLLPKTIMPNYYYFDASGQKFGLVNDQQLQSLATQGVITPNTPLETEGGHKGTAGQIPGLQFNTAVEQSPFAQPPQATPQTSGKTFRLGAIPGHILLWLGWRFFSWFDWDFRDILLPKNIRQASAFIYGCFCFWGVIFGIVTTLNALLVLGSEAEDWVMFSYCVHAVFYWLAFAFSVVIVRLVCEWQIVLMDRIIENSKKDREE